jgi:hypothetical protein
VLVPTGKKEPDAGLQLIGRIVSPPSPVLVWPQSPVPVGVVNVTTAPACPESAFTVMFVGDESSQALEATSNIAVELLLSLLGSGVVLVVLDVLEIMVPDETAPTW